MEMAYGSRGPAIGALDRGLALAGRDRLPDDPEEVLAFVRAHLLSLLSADVGPRLTMALVDDFVARFDLPSPSAPGPSPPPPSMPRPVGRVSLRPRSASAPAAPLMRVLLVDPDRVGRATLARSLMRARWGVGVVDSVQDLPDVFHGEPPPDAAIVDVYHPCAAAILEAVVAAMPGLLVIVRGSDGPQARELLSAARVTRYEIRSREAPAEELIDAVKRAEQR